VILEAFAQCLIEKGLADASYAAIGKYAGMEPPHIGYYFSTWNSMLDGSFRYVIAVGQEITVEGIAAANTPFEKLKAICDAPFDHLKRFPEHVAVLAAFQLECSRQRTYRGTHRSIRKQGQRRIKAILKQIIFDSEKTLKSELDLSSLSIAIQSLIVGYATEWMATKSSSTTKAQGDVWKAVHTLINGAVEKQK